MPTSRLAACNMTLEQNEQWREAILPLASYLTGEEWQAECTLAALLPIEERTKRFAPILDEERLTSWSVPYWASGLHLAILTWRLDHIMEPWIARFVLRSEAALVGIPIVTSNDEDLVAVYQRIYVRFVQEILRPFVEWARQAKDARRSGYEPLILLYDYCEAFSPPATMEQWPLLWRPLVGANRIESYEINSAFQLAKNLRKGILVRLNLKYVDSRNIFPPLSNDDLMRALNHQYHWCLTGKDNKEYYAGLNYTHLIAAAYLTALESECPPPDWLDGALRPA